jgi:peptidoglycan/xylan/chitin deacetylase (PgdA/CDA1 family)
MAPNWRPPYGAFNDRVKQAAVAVGFTKMWLWDVDSLDWKYHNRTPAIVDEVEGEGAGAMPQAEMRRPFSRQSDHGDGFGRALAASRC